MDDKGLSKILQMIDIIYITPGMGKKKGRREKGNTFVENNYLSQ